MKKTVFVTLLMAVSLLAHSQSWTPTQYTQAKGLIADSVLRVPRIDTVAKGGNKDSLGMILYRPEDDKYYVKKSGRWAAFTQGTGDLTDYYTKSESDARYPPNTRAINTTSPLQGGGNLSADRTLSILDAAADGATKGVASFTAADFNSSSGLISIDYPNGQAASGSTKGFLTSADWTTFNNKASATGAAGYIWNGTTAQTADFNISGGGRLGGGLGVGTTTAPTAAKIYSVSSTLPQLRTEHSTGNRMDITTSANGSTSFNLTGTAPTFSFSQQIGANGGLTVTGTATFNTVAALGTPATTYLTTNSGVLSSRTAAQVLSDIGAVDSLNARWSVNGNTVSSGQFLGSTNSAPVVVKANNDTAILVNANKQVFIDSTLTMGDYVYDRKAIPGDPPHVFEVTSSGGGNYLAQFTNYSNTTGLANIHVRKARGTKESPSGVLFGDALASFGFRGYGTNNFGPSSGAFIWFARNNFTDSLHGTECQIQTTAVGANAWYGRTYAFVFGADGSFTIPRGVSAAGDNNVATLSSLTDYGNSYLQFNNSNATRRGYIGMFGNTNQLTINADAGSTGTPTVRITNRLLVNTSTDNGSGLMVGGSISAPIATITGSTTLTATQSTVLVNNSGLVTITLPAASTCSGRIYTIKKISGAGNDVQFTADGSTKTITLQYMSVDVQSNGTSWYIIRGYDATL